MDDKWESIAFFMTISVCVCVCVAVHSALSRAHLQNGQRLTGLIGAIAVLLLLLFFALFLFGCARFVGKYFHAVNLRL